MVTNSPQISVAQSTKFYFSFVHHGSTASDHPQLKTQADKTAAFWNIVGQRGRGKESFGGTPIGNQWLSPETTCVTSTDNSLARTGPVAPSQRAKKYSSTCQQLKCEEISINDDHCLQPQHDLSPAYLCNSA